jgi:hypothetical protein
MSKIGKGVPSRVFVSWSFQARLALAGAGREGTPMLKVASEEGSGRVQAGTDGSPIDVIVREGARAMLAAALREEVAAYIEAQADERGEDGRRRSVTGTPSRGRC